MSYLLVALGGALAGFWVAGHLRRMWSLSTPVVKPSSAGGTAMASQPLAPPRAEVEPAGRSGDVLQETELLQRILLERLMVGVVTVDAQTHVIETINPTAAALFGAPADQIVGHKCHRFLCPAQEGACPITDLGQSIDNSDRCMLRQDGSKVPILKTVKRVSIAGRDRLLELFVDMTEQQRREEELKRSNQALEYASAQAQDLAARAEAANAAKSEFLANMSHEIRTPMTAILGFADLLIEEALTSESAPDQLDALQTIKRNGEHLLALINDILDLSRIEAGRLSIEQSDCAPCQVVAEVESLMRPRCESKGLEFAIEYVGAIPAVMRSDARHLRQVLINLVGNAVKFTESGGIRLIVRLAQDAAGAPTIEFDVVDTGIGMTAEQAGSLFRPFTQADTSATRRFGGTGLGLAISRRLAELLGGTLFIVETEPGQGARFRMTLPLDAQACTQMLADPAGATVITPDAASASAAPTCRRLTGRILLAEDGPDNQRLISRFLTAAGAEVSLAENGALALDAALTAKLAGRPFDVILMDMQMPVVDGYQATRTLRAKGYTGKIIALTAHAMAPDRERCLRAGCDDYASKPIDRAQLLATIRRHLPASTGGQCEPETCAACR